MLEFRNDFLVVDIIDMLDAFGSSYLVPTHTCCYTWKNRRDGDIGIRTNLT